MTYLFSDRPIPTVIDKKLIFLAGPTSRTNVFAESWRKVACDILQRINFDGFVAIPEFFESRPFTDDDWEKQVSWEWELLDKADCIVFWVPRSLPDMPGFTTNLEFGAYLEKKPKQIILGYPDNAEKMEWMNKRYQYQTHRLPCSTLECTLKEAVKMVNNY